MLSLKKATWYSRTWGGFWPLKKWNSIGKWHGSEIEPNLTWVKPLGAEDHTNDNVCLGSQKKLEPHPPGTGSIIVLFWWLKYCRIFTDYNSMKNAASEDWAKNRTQQNCRNSFAWSMMMERVPKGESQMSSPLEEHSAMRANGSHQFSWYKKFPDSQRQLWKPLICCNLFVQTTHY